MSYFSMIAAFCFAINFFYIIAEFGFPNSKDQLPSFIGVWLIFSVLSTALLSVAAATCLTLEGREL